MNPNMLLNLIKSGGNPQQMVMNMLEQQVGNNPLFNNLLSLAKENNTQGIENIARNMVAERGGNFEKEFANFRKNYKI